MIRCVIFDLDGTLLDTADDLTAAANAVCRHHGWPEIRREELLTMVGNGNRVLLQRLSPPEAREGEALEESARVFSEYYRLHCADRTAPYPGMTELLADLRSAGIKTAVLSNKWQEFTEKLIRGFFPGLTDVILGKQDGIPAKPDPTAVRMALRDMGCAPEEGVFVGDSSVDVQTAKNAGMVCCAVSWGFRSRESLEEAGADCIADTPEELRRFLLKDC